MPTAVEVDTEYKKLQEKQSASSSMSYEYNDEVFRDLHYRFYRNTPAADAVFDQGFPYLKQANGAKTGTATGAAKGYNMRE